MKKRFIKSLGLALCLIVLIGMSSTTASKAKSKDTIKVTLTVGKTYQLKVTGAKKKIKWNTSNKKVATVSNKGKIKAKKAGKAKIYAKVGKKKLICYLTVKARKTTKSKNVKPAATKKPGNTTAPINSTAPIVSSGPVVTPAATVEPTVAPTAQPEYTDGPKLEQTYHAKIGFTTNDWSFCDPKDGSNCIKNTTNGFFCKDSLGNYIADEPYEVNCEEVTIDHAGIYSFKLNGINNILQNAKDFSALYIQTDIFANKNIICKNLELYIDGKIIKKIDYDIIKKDSTDNYNIDIKNVWNSEAIMHENIPIPQDSIEIKCYLDPGQTRGITQETLIKNNESLKKYIFEFCNNELANYTELNTDREGIALEDDENLYTISCSEDDNCMYYEQYDKNSYKLKSQMQLGFYSLQGDIYYDILGADYNIANITKETTLQFMDDYYIDAEVTLNTKANQEFQRSLSAWNQLLKERLHMSLKDLGFLSYE